MDMIITDSWNSAQEQELDQRVEEQKEMQLHQGNTEALRNLGSNME